MLLFTDSFDHYQTGDIALKWSSGGGSIQTSVSRHGGQAHQYGNLAKSLSPSGSTFIIGCAVYYSSLTGHNVLQIDNASGIQVCLRLNSDGSLIARRGGFFGTDLGSASAAGVITTGKWYFLEWKVLIDNTSGTSEVRVNGVNVTSATSLDSQEQSTADWTKVTWSTGAYDYMDDVYIADASGSYNNNFLGDITVKAVFPSTGNGTHADFTCASGTDHGALVDESSSDFPDTNDANLDYVYSSTSGHRDTYNFPALGITATVHAVQVNICAKKSDTGARTYTDTVYQSSTDYDGSATVAPSDASYAYGTFVRETDPNTSSAWTVSGIDSAEFGVKVAS